jgi:hypothetical protein
MRGGLAAARVDALRRVLLRGLRVAIHFLASFSTLMPEPAVAKLRAIEPRL